MARRADIERVVREYRQRLGVLEAEVARGVAPHRRILLDRLRDELGRFLTAVDAAGIPERVTRRWVTSLPEYRALVAAAEQSLDALTAEAVRAIQWRIAEAAQLGADGASALTAASIGQPGSGMTAALGQVNVGAVTQLVGALQASSPLANLPRLTGAAIEQMTRELVRGLTNGTHSRVIGRRIAQATNMPAARAATIARTEIHRAYRESNRLAFQANTAVNAWRWQCQVGPGTCASCFAMHGTVHGLDEPMGSHPNCRCAMVPVVDNELVRSVLGIDVPDIEWPSGEQVFAQQPEAVQRSVLGAGKFEAYRDGRIQLGDTVRTTRTREWGTTRSVASLDQALKNAA